MKVTKINSGIYTIKGRQTTYSIMHQPDTRTWNIYEVIVEDGIERNLPIETCDSKKECVELIEHWEKRMEK